MGPSDPFETRVPGKWILAGEHSVIRGGLAVALPHTEFGLRLKFEPGAEDSIQPPDARHAVQALFDRITELGAVKPERAWARPRGRLQIQSTIPVAAGFGSSAALCVALTRWVFASSEREPEEFFDFARGLEDYFHGRSSGLDIAATSLGRPIRFHTHSGPQDLGITQTPVFRFHDTGLRSSTRACVQHVSGLAEREPAQAQRLDQQMSSAATQAIEALLEYDSAAKSGRAHLGTDALSSLAQAMQSAQACFVEWGLCPEPVRSLITRLESQPGVLAAKLTGAGLGGFVVTLHARPN